MGNDPQIKLVKKSISWLEDSVQPEQTETDVHISMSVCCPHCKEKSEISDALEFGKIYEYTCVTCKNKFVLIIPAYVVRKGLIEEVLHGTKR